MRLSIGVPTYNQASFLGETLESLLLQDEPFAEIVVSDNHCTDDTAKVLEGFAGRVRVVRPEQHLTMAGNWNFTVSQLTGDWVSLLSSDDLALPNFAASVRKTVGMAADATLVRAAWMDIDAKGTVLEERHLNVEAVTEPERALYEQRFGPRGSFAAFALRRDIWERLGGFSEQVTLVGDWVMWLNAGALGKTLYCDEPISKYRLGHQPGVIRKRHHIHAREMFKVFSELMPKATAMAGLGEPAWIAETSRKAFRMWVSAASLDFAASERAQLIEAMRPWADATGETALFARFEAGERITDGAFGRRVMDAVRPTARKALRALKSLQAAQGQTWIRRPNAA